MKAVQGKISQIEEIFRNLGSFSYLFLVTIKELFTPPFYRKLVFEQLYHLVLNSLSLVLVTGVAAGAVTALQMGLGLKKFGGDLYVPKIVSLSLVREMCPVFTGIMVAARVGAGIAAEIASMKVTQQIDAIRALGTSPIKKLVIPRFLALVIGLPLLTTFAIYMGLLSGMLISYAEIGITPEFYYYKVVETLIPADYFSALFKTFFFAIFIVFIGCYVGLKTKGGTKGVGEATTQVVVLSCISILISNFFLTKLFFLFVYAS
jgi:phospholipid/cholesterol/gamma-HCH transport system permease protein